MQIGHLQDALQELRHSVKVFSEDAVSEREQYQAQASAQAQVDKALYEVCSSTIPFLHCFVFSASRLAFSLLCFC